MSHINIDDSDDDEDSIVIEKKDESTMSRQFDDNDYKHLVKDLSSFLQTNGAFVDFRNSEDIKERLLLMNENLPKGRDLIITLMTAHLMHFDKYKLRDGLQSRVRCIGHSHRQCKYSYGFSEQGNNNYHSSKCSKLTDKEMEEHIKTFINKRDLKVKVDSLLSVTPLKVTPMTESVEAFKESPISIAKRTSSTTQNSASLKRQRIAIVSSVQEREVDRQISITTAPPPLLLTSSFSLQSKAANHQTLLSDFTSVVEERLKQFKGNIGQDDELKEIIMNVEFTLTASNKK